MEAFKIGDKVLEAYSGKVYTVKSIEENSLRAEPSKGVYLSIRNELAINVNDPKAALDEYDELTVPPGEDLWDASEEWYKGFENGKSDIAAIERIILAATTYHVAVSKVEALRKYMASLE